ncbi:CD209 antigen-like protein A isoform X2 [Clavelina lepadiformis]|uniref:CD209 antigen-like protein A isoform X2 n=1 Tax=Clavelina lepadiformis TaxID=159417 RepID=UPI004041B7D1
MKLMMISLLLLTIFIFSSNGQEYLTCLRNNDAFADLTNQDAPSNIRGPPGYPGKRGSSGEKGDKGKQGAPCTQDEEKVNEMKDHLVELQQQLQVAFRKLSELNDILQSQNNTINTNQVDIQYLCGVAHEDGWFASSNGYQYKMTISAQSWQESRMLCSKMGGDLAAVGMRNLASRRIIFNTLPGRGSSWIGLNDLNEEGKWMWNDGVAMTRANAGWLPNEPNNHNGNEDCAAIFTRSSTLLNDTPCSASLYGLCEKRVKSCLNIFSV